MDNMGIYSFYVELFETKTICTYFCPNSVFFFFLNIFLTPPLCVFLWHHCRLISVVKIAVLLKQWSLQERRAKAVLQVPTLRNSNYLVAFRKRLKWQWRLKATNNSPFLCVDTHSGLAAQTAEAKQLQPHHELLM